MADPPNQSISMGEQNFVQGITKVVVDATQGKRSALASGLAKAVLRRAWDILVPILSKTGWLELTRGSYLQRLLSGCENDTTQVSTPAQQLTSQAVPESSAERNVSNLLIEDRAWFVPHTTPDIPIYVGESASTAFASSLCQILDMSFHRSLHIPRTHYVSDQQLMSDPDNIASWPNQVKARLLVNVAITNVGRIHHIVLGSATFDRLDQIYRDLSHATANETGKFFGLFALGEAYLNISRTGSDQEPPGLPYFIAARELAQRFPERATLENIENMMLLSFYSHILNRRHSAYHFVGSALRMSMTLGLHHSLPQYINIDPVIHQHRVRIWWTIYCCDRLLGSEIGHPASIQDETITVDLPSMTGLNEKEMEDFTYPDYAIANIKLARILGDAIAQIYNRNLSQPFTRSVRRILRDLKEWIQNLPASLRLPLTGSTTVVPRNLIYLHLSFNQSVILVTRPVLLYVLKQELHDSTDERGYHTKTSAPIISALAGASICSARQISSLQTQCWIDGTLSKFGYSDAHYLFSSAIILTISSLLNIDSGDNLLVETASEILRTLASNGSFPASEFVRHLESVERARDKYTQRASANQIGRRDRTDSDIMVESARKTAAEMTLESMLMQDFPLDSEMNSDGSDFFSPLVGFENESFFVPDEVDHEQTSIV